MIVKNDLTELDKIFKGLEKISMEFGFPSEIYNNLCLCIDEVFTNIVRYAYDDGREHEIEIIFDYSSRKKTFTVTISDDGKPFNPLEAQAPDFSSDLMEREIGGLGIFIVLNIMCSIEYKRLESMNKLKMTKNVNGDSSK